jgi:hypothetical protein
MLSRETVSGRARRPARSEIEISRDVARRIWLRAQRLDEAVPFGEGPDATRRAVEHLGYVQIDTINVIERCHHHILYNRIPAYRRGDLVTAQSVDKTVFEYWTHALSYVPTRDLRYFLPAMKQYDHAPKKWYADVAPRDVGRMLKRIRRDGALSIRDIDDEPVEKTHLWASRKPSKKVLQLAFYQGHLTVSARAGMVKTYELIDRHFAWESKPSAARRGEVLEYLLARALRAQGVVSLDSICHLDAARKPEMRVLIDRRVRAKTLAAVRIDGDPTPYYAEAATVEAAPAEVAPAVHILSPFDPLIILRKRLEALFGYRHLFEAYVPKAKRVLGYFALPVLVDDDIVAAIDLKADRAARRLLVQQWTWVGAGNPRRHKRRIEQELHRFERFQLGDG